MDILAFIKIMDSDNSQNYKVEKLKDGLKDLEIVEWIKLIYDNNINFYATAKSMPTKNDTTFSRYSLNEVKETLLKMTNRELSRSEIIDFYENLSTELAELFIKCLRKSLFVNVSTKIINKAYKEINKTNLFDEMPYMRCSTSEELDNISFPAICQLKADGVYTNIIMDFDDNYKISKVELISRNGVKMDLKNDGIFLTKLKEDISDSFYEHIKSNNIKSIILMGELLVLDKDNKPMPRKVGNGLINSLSKQFSIISKLEEEVDSKKSKQDELNSKINQFKEIEENLVVQLWDILDKREWLNQIPCSTKYIDRFNKIKYLFENSKTITPIEHRIVNNYQEMRNYYQECIDRKEEGIIVKNQNAIYKDGTSKEQIKLKEIKDCDLLCIGFEHGSGQFEKGIGSLICVSSDNKLKVKVSGLTREMRGLEPIDKSDMSKGFKVIEGFDFNQYTNKIIAVEFNQLIKSKDSDSMSLFLPRLLEVREDKSEADDLEKISKL